MDGLNLYYHAPTEDVQGEMSGKLWLERGTELFRRYENEDLSKPVTGDAVYDFVPGRKTAKLVDLVLMK